MNAFKKVTNKISNSKIIKNPVFLVIGLIAIILVIALIYFIFLKYSPIMNFKYEGYAISGKDITENLLSSSEDSTTNKNLELTKIEEQGTIFKKLNDYFVGSKEKTEINLNYPIYINNNSAIYNLAESSTLISKDFEQVTGYPNLSISEGKVYDGNNLERADAKEYIFVKTTDEIYINLYEIKINTIANEYIIPVNSIMAFTENSIRYYTVNNNVLVFNQINDVDSNSNVQMVENNYTYEELLTRLGILQDETNNNGNNETQTNIIQEDSTNSKTEEKQENEVKQEESTETNTNDEQQTQNGYIKPKVTAEDFTGEVYTAKSILTIKDPAGRIVEAPTFEIYKDGKIYLRRTYTNSGNITVTGLVPETEYKIVGKYVYLNENGQKVENTFYEGSFTTKGYDELGSIEITKENGEIFSNKIQLTKVKITSDLNAEVIKGINQVEIETGEIRTVLKNSQVNELLQGKEITIESSEGLKSDSKINYVIKFYDKNGIELKVNNNTGETRTSKEAPTVRVNIKEQDIVSVTLGLKLTNRDDVELENYKYIVTRANGEIVQEERLAENETELLLENLDQNQYYKISIYADYDLNDNRGKQENVEIGNLVFATQPISTLGSLELIVENKELTSTTSTISYKIDEDRTDKRLIQILNELTINIVEQPEGYGDNNNQDTKEGTLIYSDILSGDEITNLQQAGIKEIKYENLKSNTTYTIEITGNVQLGNTQESIPVTYNYKEFTTLKIPAKVEIRNQFVTGNIIDFDVRIKDIDNSVLNNTVRMELRDSSNNLIDLQEVATNQEYIRKTYEKLEENQTYTLRFYADQYNEGNTDSTYQVNYLIKELEIVTEPGISGKIGLTELSKESTGKNLVDVESKIKWHSFCFNTSKYYKKEYNQDENYISLFGGKYNQGQYYVYDLREYIGQTVTVSFKAKEQNDSGAMRAYFGKGKFTTIQELQGLDKENWRDFTYTLSIDSSGFIGFTINSQDNSENGATLLVKDLQIEIGNQKTSYEPYKYDMKAELQIDLEDKRNEITTNDYYIRIYENDQLIEENCYQEIFEEAISTKKMYTVKEDVNYKIELIIKINDREYILDEQSFSTENAKEIKGIQSKEEYLEIQPEGNYILLTDLEFDSSSYSFGNNFDNELEFAGNIDFNGHRLSLNNNISNSLFRRTSSKAVIENLVIDVELNNEIETSISGFISNNNEGTIKNIQINLKNSTNVPNLNTYLMGTINYGTIENFYINLEVPLYGQGKLTLGYRDNYGTIKNGYIIGENIKAPYEITENRDIGIMAITNGRTGVIKNIYSLITVEVTGSNKNLETIGNIAVSNKDAAVIENVYSVKNSYEGNLNNGPSVYAKQGGRVENTYYFSDTIFNNNYNLKGTKMALHDVMFQQQILNTENQFIIDECIEQGYYPHLVMSSVMPNQEYISLPEVEDKDLPDIFGIEVLETMDNGAKVKFSVNNPSGETITEIKIKDIQCEITSQEYQDGKSEVVVRLYDPIRYVSQYSVMSITTKGAFNLPYTREFEDNERVIYIDLYRPIYSVDDWKAINKSLTENYQLMNDLDFINEGNDVKINNTYSGKINGNGFTIKNIRSANGIAGGLINKLTGSIENIIFESYIFQVENKTEQIGLILNSENAILDNVQIRNANITVDGTVLLNETIGVLISNAKNTKIINSSVQDTKIEIENNVGTIIVGGIVGQSNISTIQNSFVQDCEFIIRNALSYQGVGGIVGYESGLGQIKNCYSVGSMEVEGQNVGGIIGRTQGTVTSCYSMVDIQTEDEYLGGIIGNNLNSDNISSNNLALGDLYSKIDSQTMNRAIGNSTVKGNFAYEKQKINGQETKEELGATLLTRQELLMENIYSEKIGFLNQFSYEKIEQGILPKLYYSDSTNLLDGQIDNKIAEDDVLKIEDIEIEKNNVNEASLRLEIYNPNLLEITGLQIEDMENTIEKNEISGKYTYINLKVTPTRYYDSYKIEGIKYLENGEKKNIETARKIEVQFFKEIYSYEDWQSIEIGTYQNYLLMNDIDFSGKPDIHYGITVGRLETINEQRTLKNIELNINEQNGALIKSVRTNLENIKFENISINNSYSGNVTGAIAISTASMKNLSFSNITINADKMSYIGCVGRYMGNNIQNIELNEISITGNQFVGGFIGRTNSGTQDTITAEQINIKATGNYVGGIIGYIDDLGGVYYMQNMETKDSYVEGKDNVGGVIGFGMGNHLTAKNVEVRGTNSIGGVFGNKTYSNTHYGQTEKHTYYTTEDSKIYGTGNNVGGIAGASNYMLHLSVKNTDIYVTNSNSSKAGGIAGYSGGAIQYANVEDTNIISNGSEVGGIIGQNGHTISYAYVKDSKVEGYSKVGGICGTELKNNLNLTYNNANVRAYSNTAGGIVGYLSNKGMTATNNPIKIVNNYVGNGNISGISNVGGIIGDIAENLYTAQNFYWKNYVEVKLQCDDQNTVSLGIGGRADQNLVLANTYYYKYSTINGQNPTAQNEIFISSDEYLVEDELKQQSTYTSKLKWYTSDWSFGVLANSKYPIINSSALSNQEGIDIPKDSEHIIEKSETTDSIGNFIETQSISEEPEQTFEYANKEIQTYSTYSVITSLDGTQATRNAKLYVKDNNLYAIPSILSSEQGSNSEEVVPVANNLIIDSYNGKEYETVLGSDGKIYDLKESIEYPENFVNSDIESIGNNLNSDTKEIEVTYKNGDSIKFNYQTGEVISSSEAEDAEKTGLFDYIKEKIAEIGENSANGVSQEITNKYEESKELQTKLEETSVEEAIEKKNIANSEQGTEDITTTENNATNNSLTENKYISMYNEETGQYEIYNEEELLDTTKEEVVSENEKIEANKLSEYYASEGETKNTKMGIVWIVISIIGVGIILFVLRKNLKKKNA